MYYIVYIIFIYIIHSLIICHGFIYSFIHLKNIYWVAYFVQINRAHFTDYTHPVADVCSDIPEENSFLTGQSFKGHCANNSIVVLQF